MFLNTSEINIVFKSFDMTDDLAGVRRLVIIVLAVYNGPTEYGLEVTWC